VFVVVQVTLVVLSEPCGLYNHTTTQSQAIIAGIIQHRYTVFTGSTPQSG
jgi:hypothetical protein